MQPMPPQPLPEVSCPTGQRVTLSSEEARIILWLRSVQYGHVQISLHDYRVTFVEVSHKHKMD